MREIISKVKDGCSVALMVDQRVSEGPRIPFFNKPAHTTTIPAQLALKYDCKLVAISIERVKDTNFVMEVHKPYKFEKTGNDEIDTNNITIKEINIFKKLYFIRVIKKGFISLLFLNLLNRMRSNLLLSKHQI